MLPGVPLIFYGQESGNDHEVFELHLLILRKKCPQLILFSGNFIKT